MKYLITPPSYPIKASVKLPASKSISNRALILNALSYSPYDISNLSDCDDTEVMVRALNSNDSTFDIKAAGTAMRFMTAFLSKIVGEWVLTGSERMKNRPIRILVDALNSVGARIEYLEKEGFPPLKIYGSALNGGEIELDGSVSSQYISALLMVAPLMRDGLKLKLKGDIISRPYINITLKMMEAFGVSADWKGNIIEVKPQDYNPVPYRVESDWSAASYWYEIKSFSESSEIELCGLFENSLQGDSFGARLFEQLGVVTEFDKGTGVKLISSGKSCDMLEADLVNIPDLAQTFVVASVMKGVPFRFSGLQSLKIKETDRITALKNECKKLGYVLNDYNDSVLEWTGERCAADDIPVISTYEDHRMAMSFAPAALLLPKGIVIDEPGVVSKSYPAFWNDLKGAGIDVREA